MVDLKVLLDVATATLGSRVAVSLASTEPGRAGVAITYDELGRRAASASGHVRDGGFTCLAYVGTNHPALAVALSAALVTPVPFMPLSYRMSSSQLAQTLYSHPGALVVAEGRPPGTEDFSGQLVEREQFWSDAAVDDRSSFDDRVVDAEAVAVLLHTSGTTSTPKAAVLRHRHLSSYLLESVELASADESEAALVSVPPYHVAGVASLLTNLYAGRRVVYLPAFSAESWCRSVEVDHISHAMVVPTMLSRIVEYLEVRSATIATLGHLSYGGSRTSATLLRRALERFPNTAFTQGYGLTETASTVAVLGPDEHRAARNERNETARRRAIPGIEIRIVDAASAPCPPDQPGDIQVRGAQISGEYVGHQLDSVDGWFATRDRGRLDGDGYLYVDGRADDTIIRGGENIAPAEIEDVLLEHPDVLDAAVVGPPHDEWGQVIVAYVVVRGGAIDPELLRQHVRDRLRGSRTPDEVRLVDEMPTTETGKVLRRLLMAEYEASRS
jgi:acyl-CoA synthetase (AMP-forming)/AMP-acid ligase II